jgi:hypothetical protein
MPKRRRTSLLASTQAELSPEPSHWTIVGTLSGSNTWHAACGNASPLCLTLRIRPCGASAQEPGKPHQGSRPAVPSEGPTHSVRQSIRKPAHTIPNVSGTFSRCFDESPKIFTYRANHPDRPCRWVPDGWWGGGEAGFGGPVSESPAIGPPCTLHPKAPPSAGPLVGDGLNGPYANSTGFRDRAGLPKPASAHHAATTHLTPADT